MPARRLTRLDSGGIVAEDESVDAKANKKMQDDLPSDAVIMVRGSNEGVAGYYSPGDKEVL